METFRPMVSRYSLEATPEQVATHFGLDRIEPFPPRPAIAPTEPVGIVRRSPSGAREMHLVRWGLVPGWVKDPRTLAPLFSARAETVLEKPAFRGGIRHRRCVVAADGLYVWKEVGGRRVPHLVHRPDRGLMGFAAIADHWLGADGSELESMAILTIAAGPSHVDIADRLPVLVAPGDVTQWLDCRSGTAETVRQLLVPPAGPFSCSRSPPLPRNRLTKLGE
jgi:putative SOS response-associated peptidase YedK